MSTKLRKLIAVLGCWLVISAILFHKLRNPPHPSTPNEETGEVIPIHSSRSGETWYVSAEFQRRDTEVLAVGMITFVALIVFGLTGSNGDNGRKED